MFSNDYVSEFEPERGLVVHLSVGVHVANVAVDDQVHVNYVSYLTLTNMTEVASLHVASHAELIFIIVISNQFKTGVRMPLTSSVKELGAILQKLINLDKIQNEMKMIKYTTTYI